MYSDYCSIGSTCDLDVIRRILKRYGYGIRVRVTDNMGRKWVSVTYPEHSGGTTCYHSSITEFKRWARVMILNRAMEEQDSDNVQKILDLKWRVFAANNGIPWGMG